MNYAPLHDRRSAVRLTGAVYTPSGVAEAVVRIAMKDLPPGRLNVLEPSVGDGAFLEQLSGIMPNHDHVAIDIDELVVANLRAQTCGWPQSPKIHTSDFIQFACSAIETETPRFDLIIGNPPFIRKHNFSETFKEAIKKLSGLIDYPLPNLKNSWAAFLMGASKLVTDDGIIAFVLPYELITVAYGHAVLGEMLKVFPRIDLFVSNEKAFPEIDQDAIIFVGRRKTSSSTGLYIQRVQKLSNLANAIEHPIIRKMDRPLALDLNAFLIEPETMPELRQLQTDLQVFSDLATSAPGVVTGANDFFILKHSEVLDLGLQPHVLPILKKQSIVDRSPLFTTHDFKELKKHDPCQLFHVRGDFENLDPEAQHYIATGAKTEIPQRYKCRKRRNWYEVRLVECAPSFFFKRSHGYPRICVNEANVHITDTAYGIHPKLGYTARGICFSFYNSITLLFAETNGRFYGGGVLELSPTELKGLPIIYHEPTDEEFEAFLTVHKSAGNDPEPVLDFGDRWVREQSATKNVDLEGIRRAWSAVRSHRLRHSSRLRA